MDKTDFVSEISEKIGMTREEVLSKLEKLDIETMIDLLSDASEGHFENIKHYLIGWSDDDKEDSLHESYSYTSDSGVLGIGEMPSFERMRQLAGITPLPEPVYRAQSISTQPLIIDEESNDEEEFCCVMKNFDEIERNLPKLRISDGKTVKERITRLFDKLNENYRKKK